MATSVVDRTNYAEEDGPGKMPIFDSLEHGFKVCNPGTEPKVPQGFLNRQCSKFMVELLGNIPGHHKNCAVIKVDLATPFAGYTGAIIYATPEKFVSDLATSYDPEEGAEWAFHPAPIWVKPVPYHGPSPNTARTIELALGEEVGPVCIAMMLDLITAVGMHSVELLHNNKENELRGTHCFVTQALYAIISAGLVMNPDIISTFPDDPLIAGEEGICRDAWSVLGIWWTYVEKKEPQAAADTEAATSTPILRGAPRPMFGMMRAQYGNGFVPYEDEYYMPYSTKGWYMAAILDWKVTSIMEGRFQLLVEMREQEVKELDEELDALLTKFENREREIRELKAALEKRNKRVGDLEGREEKLKGKIKNLEEDKKKSREKTKEMVARENKYKERIRDLEKQLKEAKDKEVSQDKEGANQEAIDEEVDSEDDDDEAETKHKTATGETGGEDEQGSKTTKLDDDAGKNQEQYQEIDDGTWTTVANKNKKKKGGKK